MVQLAIRMREALNTLEKVESRKVAISVEKLNFFYGQHQALFDISLTIPQNQVLALIGPSGCGKSTFLRTLNRMNEIIEGTRLDGSVKIFGQDIYSLSTNLVELRKRVGMVFQRSNPFPKSIFDNVAYGPRLHGVKDKNQLFECVKKSLERADLWSEVRDRLNASALDLSGGQQQRLCIARALAVNPQILLMDEPASALDPRSTSKIEDLISELCSDYSIVIVTHNMQQAARVSHQTAFFYEGQLVEVGPTGALFQKPREKRTEDYVTGRFG